MMTTPDGRRISAIYNCRFCGFLQPGWLTPKGLLDHLLEAHYEKVGSIDDLVRIVNDGQSVAVVQ